LVYGVRPVEQLLTTRPQAVERIFVSREARGPVGRLLRTARQAGIPVSHLDRDRLLARLGRRGGQGIAAVVAPRAYDDVDHICRDAARGGQPLLVVLDRVTDPGNLGAVLRSCAAVGVAGVLLSSDGTVGLTPHVLKASAGAAERVRVGREPSPAKRVKRLAAAGFSTVALDAEGEQPWDAVDLTGPTVVVAGGEERGARPGLLSVCSKKVAIPLAPGVESLNVGVALSVLLFEAIRQRRSRSGAP
jgi:23S rRNA (guanosine2251-2'-O)-methyltransferase